MLPLRQGVDAVEYEAILASPYHDIAVRQGNPPDLVGALRAAPQEDGRQA